MDRQLRQAGLAAEEPDDRALADDFLQLLQREKVDFTLAFRLLSDAITGPDAALHDLFGRERPALSDWLARWRQRMAREEGPCRTAPQRRGRSIPS